DLNPKDTQARMERAEALLDAGQYELARTDVSFVLSVLPAADKTEKLTGERVRALLLRVRACVAQALTGPAAGRQEALAVAREDADAARQQPGTLPDPYLALATVHRARAALEPSAERRNPTIALALDACGQARAIAPGAPEVAIARGDIHLA